ncbi:UNVERIFIED_CONTAM: hypothetical protein K2H54_047178 [Gekko kuhli]
MVPCLPTSPGLLSGLASGILETLTVLAVLPHSRSFLPDLPHAKAILTTAGRRPSMPRFHGPAQVLQYFGNRRQQFRPLACLNSPVPTEHLYVFRSVGQPGCMYIKDQEPRLHSYGLFPPNF